MPKYFSFPKWPASDECPEVPRSVRVWGDHKQEKTQNDGAAALAVLKKALTEDPKLEHDHPEFLNPDERKQEKEVKEEPATKSKK